MCHYYNLHVFLSEKFSSSQPMDVGNFLNYVNSCVVHVHVKFFFFFIVIGLNLGVHRTTVMAEWVFFVRDCILEKLT